MNRDRTPTADEPARNSNYGAARSRPAESAAAALARASGEAGRTSPRPQRASSHPRGYASFHGKAGASSAPK